MIKQGKDLSPLFNLRRDFTIAAVTGRQGSRYEEVAVQLSKGFEGDKFEDPDKFDLSTNSYKKYKIVHRFARENFLPYQLIRYDQVLLLYILQYPFADLITFLRKKSWFRESFEKLPDKIQENFSKEVKGLSSLQNQYSSIQAHLEELGRLGREQSLNYAQKLYRLFFGEEYQQFYSRFIGAISMTSLAKGRILLETMATSIRKCGYPFSDPAVDPEPDKVFTLAEWINNLIKCVRRRNSDKRPTKVIIDSLRVPLEIMFFRQRYSAFYLFSVNRDDNVRDTVVRRHYKEEYKNMKFLFEEEYTGGKGKEFYKKYIRECIEKADIHISFRSAREAQRMNRDRKDSTSPYFSWRMQLLKYVSLIEHPGLITPSPEERIMQMAYAAKCNSGCISRQVGAAITDESYAIKAIGWNNPPKGQVPCLLRDAEVLLHATEEEIEHEKKEEKKFDRGMQSPNAKRNELHAFTPYEKTDPDFKRAFVDNYDEQIKRNRHLVKGRNICFCFKTLKNSLAEGKNQVHTRSLHAEESAFLQITKYGGVGIKGGKLFTTASPCELCSKKAYQLGIKVIYYLDPYPGISYKHILSAGTNKPELRLFNGAIGNAYHWLYEPLLPYKDELSLVLGQEIEDLTIKQKKKIDSLQQEINRLKRINRKLST